MSDTKPTSLSSHPKVLLVAHGSARHPDSVLPVKELARLVAERGPFTEVEAVFMKARPQADPSALNPDGPTIVVPIFMGHGYYTDVLVPQMLGIGAGNPRIVYTLPVGAHPAIPALMIKRALAACAAADLSPDQATLYLVAHGSSKPGGSGTTARHILTALQGMGVFARVDLGFLEQAPKAEGWRIAHPDGPVVALPLLVAAGAHTSQDMPRLFGFDDGAAGLRHEGGRRVVLVSSLGVEPDLVDLVIELAKCHYEAFAASLDK